MKNIAIIACLAFGAAHAEPVPTDNWWGGDKKKHVAAWGLLGAGAAALDMRPVPGLGACMAVGVAREVYDYYKPSPGYKRGQFSVPDLAADAVGCGLGYLAGNGVRILITGRGFGVAARF